MRNAIYFVAAVLGVVYGNGCDTVPVPLGSLEIRSMAISDTGELAVLAGHSGKPAYIWVRTDFEDAGEWRPEQREYEDAKLLYFGTRLCSLRRVAGRTDVYSVRDGEQLSHFGDVADAVATPDELIVARPWGQAGQHVFFRIKDGHVRNLLVSWQFVPGTLAAYDFGKGFELYWTEADAKSSRILRLATRCSETEVVLERPNRIFAHPIMVQKSGDNDVTAWMEQTPGGLRARSRRLEEGIWVESFDEKGEISGGAISYTGRWGVGWDRFKRDLTYDENK